MIARALAAAAAVGLLALVGGAAAYWSGGGATTGSAAGAAASLPGGRTPGVAVTGRSVVVSVPQLAIDGVPLGALAAGGYVVRRYAAGGDAALVPGSDCAATLSGQADTLTCTEIGLASGRWQYSVTPVVGRWSGAESARSAVAAVAPSTPVGIVLADGAEGITQANAGSLVFAVAHDGTAGATDVVTVTGTSGALTTTRTVAGAPTSPLVVPGFDLSGFPDGDVRVTAVVTSAAGDDSGVAVATFAKDSTAPSAPSLTLDVTSPTNAETASWRVELAEPVRGLDASDFDVVAVGLGGTPAVTGVTGAGSTYTVTATTGTGDGALTLRFLDDDSVVDAAGNPVGGIGAGAVTVGPAVTLDRTAPQVLSVTRVGPDATNAAEVQWTVTLSEDVAEVDPGDVSVGGTTGALVTGVVGSGVAWVVTASTGIGDGTLQLDVLDDDSVTDAAGNPLGGTGAANGSFTGGETIAIDKTAPTVTAIALSGVSPTRAASVSWTVTFSESVAGVSSGDFAFTETVSGTPAVTAVTGSGTTYTVTASTGTGNGTIRLDLRISGTGIADAVGNAVAGGFTGGQEVTLDRTAPTVSSIARVGTTPTNAASVSWTVTFSESVTGVSSGDFSFNESVSGSPAVTGVSGSGAVYTVTASTGSGNGSIRLDLRSSATGIADIATNAIATGFTGGQSYAFDRTAPSVSSISRTGAATTAAASVSWTVTFSESATGVDAGDFALTTSGLSGTSVTGISGSGRTYTVTASTGTGDGTLRLDLRSSGTGIADAAGNAVAGGFTGGQTVTVDRTAPVLSDVTATPRSTSGGNRSVTVAGTSDDGGTVTVVLTSSGQTTQTVTATPTGGSWSVSANLRTGRTWAWSVTQVDAAGNVSVAASGTVAT